MLNIEQLRDEREQGFNEWFREWWNHINIEKWIVDRNVDGFTNVSFVVINRNTSEYEKNRYLDPLFIKNVRAKLIGFNCYIEQSSVGSGYHLVVSWAEEESGNNLWS